MHKDKKMKVLVVDDEATFARNTAKLLNARGFDARAAFSAAEAIAAVTIESWPAEVILLDMRMPDMDGMAALRRLKSANRWVAVIMLTGHATVETGVEAIREGAFDYLIKPCDIEDLVGKLRLVGQVEKMKQHPVLWPRTRAGEIMFSSFVRLYPEDPLTRAVEIFNLNRMRMTAETLFVVDHADHLQGFLTLTELVNLAQSATHDPTLNWDILRENAHWLPNQSVGSRMVKGGPFASTDMRLAQLAQIMMAHRLQSLPVLENERVIGVVRLRDVLNHLQDSEMEEEP